MRIAPLVSTVASVSFRLQLSLVSKLKSAPCPTASTGIHQNPSSRSSRFVLLCSRSFTKLSLSSIPEEKYNNNNNNSSDSSTASSYHHGEKVHHYVFGYGSLICPESRSVTNPTLKNKEPLPVLIHNVERAWSARIASGYTAMGVKLKEGAECTGILIEVEHDELHDLDVREANYDRLPIHLDNINQVPFLQEGKFYKDDHPVFEAKESDDDSADKYVKVWIYMQKDSILADPSHPIPQSYVDIIIRGCLTISEDFAKSVIETTAGWSHDEDHWVDDRDLPIYRRADSEYSSRHGHTIDQILEESQPEAFDERVDYDPLEHLDALADALEENKAHPKAIKHIVTRIKKSASRDDLRIQESSK